MPRQEATVITNLPDDVLYLLVNYLDVRDISRFSRTCWRLYSFCKQNAVWCKIRKRLTLINGIDRREEKVFPEEDCRVALRWNRGKYRDELVVRHKTNQMPWMQHDGYLLWISHANVVRCYQPDPFGQLNCLRVLNGHPHDVGRFKTDGRLLVTGARDGSICVFECSSGEQLYQAANCHQRNIQDVDFKKDIVATGSKDASVKIWAMTDSLEAKVTFPTLDRVWSLALNPHGTSVAVGTTGRDSIPPLRLWDIQSGNCTVLGETYRHGAGVLHVLYENDNVLYSCGYDTNIRMWDLRVQTKQCVKSWEEPFDSTIYCMWRDGASSLFAGTARHGLARLWDLRKTRPVQFYYTGRISSPVYSLVAERRRLYVALDKGIHMLNFDI